MLDKKEFIKYIESFNRRPGCYTDEELYAIGKKHKELKLKDRDWISLAKTLGVNKTGETFRTWIKSKQKEEGTLPKDTSKLSGRTVEDLSFDEAQDKLVELKQNLYIQQIKTRDERAAYNRKLASTARFEELVDCFTRSAETTKLPKIKYEGKKSKCENEAVLLFSDMHIGVNFNCFTNVYNTEIAQKRVAKLVSETIRYCKMHNVKRLNILNLGDLIHGAIHTNARLEQKENVIDQITIASQILVDAVNKLQEAAPEVVYRSVVDNHSRLTPNKEEAIPEENFNRLIDTYVEISLKGSKVQFPKDNLDVGIGRLKLFNGETIIFAHGHEDNYSQIIQNYIEGTEEFINYVCVGHLHNSKMKSYQKSKLFINGSICGVDNFAFSKRLFGKAEQTLLIFEGKDLVDVTFNLQEVE